MSSLQRISVVVSRYLAVGRSLGLTDDGVDSSKLLETLNSAGDEQSLLGFDAVVLQEILPGTSANGGLIRDCLDDGVVKTLHLNVIGGSGMNSCQNFETLIWAIMRGEPSWGFRNEGQDEQYGDDADALKNDGDSPGIATGVAGEGIVNPVDKEDAKVQSG